LRPIQGSLRKATRPTRTLRDASPQAQGRLAAPTAAHTPVSSIASELLLTRCDCLGQVGPSSWTAPMRSEGGLFAHGRSDASSGAARTNFRCRGGPRFALGVWEMGGCVCPPDDWPRNPLDLRPQGAAGRRWLQVRDRGWNLGGNVEDCSGGRVIGQGPSGENRRAARPG